MVKKILPTTQEEREKFLVAAGYNVFSYPARALYVDLLTDSGTCAMTQNNLQALMLGDESYARNSWYYAFLDAMRDFTERGTSPKKTFLSLMDPTLSHQKFQEDFLPTLGDSSIGYN